MQKLHKTLAYNRENLREFAVPALGAEFEAACHNLGVRGLIKLPPYDGFNAESAQQKIIAGLLASLAQQKVRRVHAIVADGSAACRSLKSFGFIHPEGESLYTRTLSKAPSASPDLPTGYVLRDGQPIDLFFMQKVLAEIDDSAHRDLAIQSWEYALIADGAHQKAFCFKVIECEGHPVGISIGGASGQHGTISHTWVHQSHRQNKLGHALSEATLRCLWDSGARDVHLMIVAGNDGAARFWEKQGFANSPNIFLEIDQ
jgi:GNAT superfamily N-acetyltransferase